MPLEVHQTSAKNTIDLHNRSGARYALVQSIANMEQEISRIRQEILEAKTSINVCSAISSLPSELLSEIFILACQPEYNTIGGLARQDISPLRIGAVCKAWRNLAWSTYQLWASIVFVRKLSGTLLPGVKDLLVAWISRSKNHPLSILVNAPKTLCMGPMMNTLFETAPRWENVSFFLDHAHFGVFEKSNHFPILDHFSIRMSEWRAKPAQWKIDQFDIFQSINMPQINCLHLPKYISHFGMGPSTLHSLTTLSVDYINNDEACLILRFTAGTLENFVAHRLEANDDAGGDLIHLPMLRRLVITRANGTALDQFLSDIVTPGMEDLTIETQDCRGGLIDSMPGFLCASQKLQRLHMTGSGLPVYSLVSCILNAHSLSELHLRGNQRVHKALAVGLGPPAVQNSTGDYLPLLQHLTLIDCSPPIRGLPEMLTYRSSGISPAILKLKSVSIKTYTCSEEQMKPFQKAADHGLEIKIITLNGTHHIKKIN